MIVSHLLSIVELLTIRYLDLIELAIDDFEVRLIKMSPHSHHIIGLSFRMHMIPSYC